MNHPKYLSAITLSVVLTASLALPAFSADAPAAPTLAQDANYTLGNAQIRVLAGSQTAAVVATDTGLTFTIGAGEAVFLRAAGPVPPALENDADLITCNVLKTRENQLLINGPRTVTVWPSTSNCTTSNIDINTTPMFTISQPTAGQVLKAGDAFQIFWTETGRSVASVRLRLSTDGGLSYPVVIADDVTDAGFYSWTVPADTFSTTQARIKLEGLNGNPREVAAMVLSPVFAIDGVTPPAPPASVPAYDPVIATAAAASIDVNQGFDLQVPSFEPLCAAGLRIKGRTSPAVYFCGADGKRHAFPNQKIHDSWYAGDFAGVVTVSDENLARVQLGANVKYRPGVSMVKIQTDPKVYAVDANGALRWVSSEAVAVSLYGAGWNQLIDDVPDSFFADYTIGEPIE